MKYLYHNQFDADIVIFDKDDLNNLVGGKLLQLVQLDTNRALFLCTRETDAEIKETLEAITTLLDQQKTNLH